MHAQPGVPHERRIELPPASRNAVVRPAATDQFDTQVAGISGDRGDVEIPVRPAAVGTPRAVPRLPSFAPPDQHGVDPVVGGEFEVTLDLFGRRIVPLFRRPGVGLRRRRPPDTDALHRPYPLRVPDLRGFVQIQDQRGVDESHGFGSQMHGAPRRDETSRDTRLRPVGQRREVAPEGERIAPAERHLGIVVQRGFVDAAVKPRDAERRRSVGVPEVAQRHRTAERLADARIRGNGPRVAVRGEAELGQLAGDDERIARRDLVLVAEAQTVVEEAETHREAHLAAAVQRDGHLVVAAAVALVLAPRLGPLLIDRGVFGLVHPEIVREVRLRGLQTEQRRSEKRTVADRDRIAHFAALPVRGELQTDRTVGRGDLGFRRAGERRTADERRPEEFLHHAGTIRLGRTRVYRDRGISIRTLPETTGRGSAGPRFRQI